MDFTTAVKTCFQKYFTFSGRARRSEYWWWVLFTILAGLAIAVVEGLFLGYNAAGESWLSSIFNLVVFIPGLAVASRRLHDIGKSGWFQLMPYLGLLLFIPGAIGAAAGSEGVMILFFIIGGLLALGLAILLIVWLARDSEPGSNRFGQNPKYDGVEDIFS